MKRAHIEEEVFKALMMGSTLIVVGSLASVFISVLWRGAPALTLEMITQTPKGGYYLGKEGGILNAIIGSLYLAIGATVLSSFLAIPLAIYLSEYLGETRLTSYIRRVLDVLCGIPSIVYGAFTFTIMVAVGARASLLWGIITITMFEFPIITRNVDEILKKVPFKLRETSLSLGATRWEMSSEVIIKQAMPGILSAILIGFGRAIGDAAAVLLTAGYTDNIPQSLSDPVASLPLAVFFQLSTPIAEVQQRAYAAGAILLFIVLGLSFVSRLLGSHLMKYVVR